MILLVAPGSDFWSDWANQVAAAFADWAVGMAQLNIAFLLTSFGSSTEPDFSAIAPVYERMLAIALLVLGGVMALALIERTLGGQHGVGLNVVPRVVLAVFFAYSGRGVVEYLAHYAALLATTWSGDLERLSGLLGSGGGYGTSGAQTNVLGLIMLGLFLTLLSLLVVLELVMRSALILLVTAFVPFVCVLSVWPRMASAAAGLVEFLVGLLLSKFVIATAIYIGFRLVTPWILTSAPGRAGDWLFNGVAILLVAAFSPVVLFQALRFAHGTAGNVVRDLGAAGLSMAPISPALRMGQSLLRHPAIGSASRRVRTSLSSGLRKVVRR